MVTHSDPKQVASSTMGGRHVSSGNRWFLVSIIVFADFVFCGFSHQPYPVFSISAGIIYVVATAPQAIVSLGCLLVLWPAIQLPLSRHSPITESFVIGIGIACGISAIRGSKLNRLLGVIALIGNLMLAGLLIVSAISRLSR